MRDYSLGYYHTGNNCIILDTGAIFSGFVLSNLDKSITTSSVIQEVKDEASKNILNIIINADKLSIIDPDAKFLLKIKEEAKKWKLSSKLSKTDLDVLALSLQYKEKCEEVYLATDDYSIQKLAVKLGIKIIKIKYKGIKELKK
ncbi:hypothetical protein [Caldisphaera sp.]|uniref:hypothetical protein n=1 Tax=Caldisphaera sp. TaxID=2060322 RepID=UPI0025C1A2C2|nr:hypothetical protein [Caldisphaera sp.]